MTAPTRSANANGKPAKEDLLPAQGARRVRDLDARLREKKARWEHDWTIESERPESELATTVPMELKAAVERGWFLPGGSVLDIGSGRGQISAWLAERGYKVLGADLAESATQLARRHFSRIGPSLEFRTIDIVMDAPEPGRFDAVLDRGCFHGMAPELTARYVENVAVWSKPGARMLLFHPVLNKSGAPRAVGEVEQMVVQAVRRSFRPWFEMRVAARTAEPLVRSAGSIPRKVLPGLVFRFIRRPIKLTPTNRATEAQQE